MIRSFIGTRIYGFCNGYFGRDNYEPKVIILEGKTWIVCSYLDPNKDRVACVNFDSEEEKIECIEEWSIEPEEEDW